MKKQLLMIGAAAVLAVPQLAGAEGFAINEWTADGVAMGGARMFAENDPGNIAYNPASITKVKGEALKQSLIYISPHGKYNLFDAKDNNIDSGHNVVHPGWLPSGYYVKQMNDKEWFGIGAFTRFGMISEFERHSLVSSNAFMSKLIGISITPTYARKFDKKWSAAVGAEVNYVGLDLEKNIYKDIAGKPTPISPTHLEGESWALGWNAAVNYAFDDKNEMGVVYRSKINHSMEADFHAYSPAGTVTTGAYGEVTLPDSWSIGYNHKFDDKTRVELNGTYTKWSTYDALNIYFDDTFPASENPKNYSDGWRYAIGIEHKLSDKYTLMGGFAYDESSIPYDGGDFIVPTGDRRTYSIGARYNDDKQAVTLALGLIDIGGLSFKGHTDKGDVYDKASTHDNYAKVIGVSYEYHF